MPDAVRTRTAAALTQNADELVAFQKRVAPKGRGRLQRSIRAVKGNYKVANANVRGFGARAAGDPDLTISIVAGDAQAWYARIVEFGSKPHIIKPRRAKALKIRGRMLAPGQQIKHPGARPTPYFYPPYRALKKRMAARVNRAMRRAIKDIVS